MTAGSMHARLAERERREQAEEKRAERRRRRLAKRHAPAGLGEQLRRLVENAATAADRQGQQP